MGSVRERWNDDGDAVTLIFLMSRYILISISILLSSIVYAQRDKSLPSVGHNIYGDSCHALAKAFITRHTEYVFDKHPLIWAREQAEQHLLKTDTLYNEDRTRKTVYYYSRQHHLIQIVRSSTDQGNKSTQTKVYDKSNNLVFYEGLDEGSNTVWRIRRGYDEFSRLLFECVYWETPIARLTVFLDNKPPLKYKEPNCDCDF